MSQANSNFYKFAKIETKSVWIIFMLKLSLKNAGVVTMSILKDLVFFLSSCSNSKWDKVQYECIKCLKAYMNNKVSTI